MSPPRSRDSKEPRSSRRVRAFSETVFATYTRLAAAHGAINLGQGYPDFAPPDFALSAYRSAALGDQQYAPLPGLPELLAVLARRYGARWGQALDTQANVLVTVGATEALFAAVQALVDPGDEVILFEPFYDAYPADVTMAGGVPKVVALEPTSDGHWALDAQALRRAVTPKTKLIILNTPHNPTGTVFRDAELDEIIAVAHAHDLVIVSDEVYEEIFFTPHRSVAARPGGFDRSLVISSLGKTFAVTGWKIGWAVGPAALVRAVRHAHQWIPFVAATPLQRAAAEMLEVAEHRTYYAELRAAYARKRELLLDALRRAPFEVHAPEGSTFAMADGAALGYPDAAALCLALPERAGVAAIPVSAFCTRAVGARVRHLVRFAFCKTDEALLEAGRRLAQLEPRT